MTEEAKQAVRSKKEINQDFMVTVDNFNSSPYTNKNKDLLKRSLDDIEQIIIHCTAVGNKTFGKWKNDVWETPEACIKYDLGANHISKTGLATATYSFYINGSGNIWQLVSMNIKTAHAGIQNNNSVGVCINHDGVTDSEITVDLYNSVIDTICYIFDKLDWSYSEESVKDRVHFHRDYSPKLCPGKLDKENLQNDVIDRLSTWGDNN